MTDELDEIYEITSVGGANWWISKDEYLLVLTSLREGIITREDAVIFKTLSGTEVVIPAWNLDSMNASDREERETNKERNKRYREETTVFGDE